MFISVIQTTPASARRRVVVEWQNLPADILLMIAQRSEIRHLRAVCSLWRSSLPLPYKAHHPLRFAKIPLPSLFGECNSFPRDDLSDLSYLTLTERNIYCLEPLGNDDADSPESCWIVKLEEMSSGKMRFYDSLSSYYPYPIPAVVNFLDCRVSLVRTEYDFRNKYSSSKVVLSEDAILCRFGDQNLGYFKFGDERWTMIHDRGDHGLSYSIKDIIYHEKKFYVIDTTGRIIVVDSSSRKVEPFVSPGARVDQRGQRCYDDDWFFVQSNSDLFLVQQYRTYIVYGQRPLVRFKVYRLNSDEQQWNEVTNLGDQSFFISSYDECTSFSIGSGQFSGCGKNFIYFHDWTTMSICEDEPGDQIGIFSLEDNSSHPISRYSRLFWPIPSWLKQV